MTTFQNLAERAKEAFKILSISDSRLRRDAILMAAQKILAAEDFILKANAKDMEVAKQKGLSNAMLDRLLLTSDRIRAIVEGISSVADQEDPLGIVLDEWNQPNGLYFKKVSCPIGVIGMIYEARPNVTADAAALCLKSGNCVILRSGSDSINSSLAIANCIRNGIKEAGLPEDSVIAIESTERSIVGEMLSAQGYLDLIIPRGGKELTKRIAEESRVPTLQHLDGNCHIYIHKSANPEMALKVVVNGKLRRTGICGATESLVIDREALHSIFPKIANTLVSMGCEIRADEASRAINPAIKPASEEDWSTEYLDKIISVKTVDDVDEAINHINKYSSHHTEAIIADDKEVAEYFLKRIDSSIVLHNASTQFADGGEFGFGAEIGISTGRIHARGPVGAKHLTTYKYLVSGNGTVRAG